MGQDAIAAGVRLFLDAPVGTRHEVVVVSTRHHHGRLLLRLEGVASPEAAEAFKGRTVWLRHADVALGQHEYLDQDLIGLRLVDAAGGELATVSAVRHYPAQDCLVVEPGTALVPMVRQFIKSVDIAAGRIVVELPSGMLNESLAEEA